MWGSGSGVPTEDAQLRIKAIQVVCPETTRHVAHVLCTMQDQIQLGGKIHKIVRAIMAVKKYTSKLIQITDPTCHETNMPETPIDVFAVAKDIAEFDGGTEQIVASSPNGVFVLMAYYFGRVATSLLPGQKLIVFTGKKGAFYEQLFNEFTTAENRNRCHFVDPSDCVSLTTENTSGTVCDNDTQSVIVLSTCSHAAEETESVSSEPTNDSEQNL